MGLGAKGAMVRHEDVVVEIVDGVVPEYLAASRKGTPEDQWDAFEAEVRSLYKQMARIAITPEWAKLIDFETTLPSATAGRS